MSGVPKTSTDEPQEPDNIPSPWGRANNSNIGMALFLERRADLRQEMGATLEINMRELRTVRPCRSPYPPSGSMMGHGRDRRYSSSLPIQSCYCDDCIRHDCCWNSRAKGMQLCPDTEERRQRQRLNECELVNISPIFEMRPIPPRSPAEGSANPGPVTQHGISMETGNPACFDNPSGYYQPCTKRKERESSLDIFGNGQKKLCQDEHVRAMLSDSETNMNGMGFSAAYPDYQEVDYYNPDFPGMGPSRVLGRQIRRNVTFASATSVSNESMEVENGDEEQNE